MEASARSCAVAATANHACSCTAPPGSGSGSGSRSFKFQRTRASMERAARTRTRTRRESPLGTGQVGASSASPVAASLSEAYIAQQNRGAPPPRTRSARPCVGPLISADMLSLPGPGREAGADHQNCVCVRGLVSRHGGRHRGSAAQRKRTSRPIRRRRHFIRDMRRWFTCSRLGPLPPPRRQWHRL